MLRIYGRAARFCDGVSRRNFIRIGALGLGGLALPEPAFLEEVVVQFGIASPSQSYHVPLIVSPWSYSTYRGS